MFSALKTCRSSTMGLVQVLLLFLAGRVASLPNPPQSNALSQAPQIITWFYSDVPSIRIHDGQGQTSWTWDATTGLGSLPDSLKGCVQGGMYAPEVKLAQQGRSLVAIIGHAAVLINYAPGRADDKEVQFAVCLEGETANAHTLELLPGKLLAVATTGQGPEAGVWVYDANRIDASPVPVQKLPGVRAIHGMVWEQQSQTLWAAGNTAGANGSEGISYGVIQGYLSTDQGLLSKSATYTMSVARQLNTEWVGEFASWWDGPHDLVPVPSERILLFPMDRDIHAVDLETGKFNDSGEQLVDRYLKGFQTLGGTRTGHDGEVLPRSDIKSISLLPDGGELYVQAPWMDSNGPGHQVNLLSPTGQYSTLYPGDMMYRSRWFAEIPGWGTAG